MSQPLPGPDEPDDEPGTFIPFGIDNGELRGLSRNQCFVLGVEFQSVLAELQEGIPFSTLVHEVNVARLRNAAKVLGRYVRFAPADTGDCYHLECQ